MWLQPEVVGLGRALPAGIPIPAKIERVPGELHRVGPVPVLERSVVLGSLGPRREVRGVGCAGVARRLEVDDGLLLGRLGLEELVLEVDLGKSILKNMKVFIK